jgi:hypothetical protein
MEPPQKESFFEEMDRVIEDIDPAKGEGIRSDYLHDFSARSEETRQKLLSLQSWVNQIWAGRAALDEQ